MSRFARGALAALCGLALSSAAQGLGPLAGKHLIEFGWDEPDTAFMRKHIAEMQKTPFDGCVFHITYSQPNGKPGSFVWEAWGKRAFTEAEVRQAVVDLRATRFGRFNRNFLRFNTCPADLDWFDDYGAVLNNARLAASVARRGRCPGLLFDIEQYNAPLFRYRSQRDAATKSWDAYAAQVRLRGRQVMRAFQQGYPGLTVFMSFGYSLPWSHADGHPERLPDADYGLLAPFMDGMVEAAQGKTRIIDGNEHAYGIERPEDFRRSYQQIKRDLLPIVADPAKYRRVVSCSFGIWLDRDWRARGWDTDDPSRNPHPPQKMEALVRAALAATDQYVWVYSETPRWWTPAGGPSKLPAAYADAVRRARR